MPENFTSIGPVRLRSSIVERAPSSMNTVAPSTKRSGLSERTSIGHLAPDAVGLRDLADDDGRLRARSVGDIDVGVDTPTRRGRADDGSDRPRGATALADDLAHVVRARRAP